MSGAQQEQQDMDQQDQEEESIRLSPEIEMKQDIPDLQTSQQPQSEPTRQRAFRFFCCCCCCRSLSPEPGGPVNKDSASCPQAHTSGAQSATDEPAETSKAPSGEKDQLTTKSLLHRLFGSTETHHTRYHNKHRSEHVKDGVLNGCTHGEASRPRSSQDIPESKNEMKHSCSKTNIKEVIDSEQPTGSEAPHSFQECTSTVPHTSTCDTHSSESKEEEEVADDAASGTVQAANEENDLTTNPTAESPSSLASPRPSHSAPDLQSPNSQINTATFPSRKPDDGCSPTSPPEQTSPEQTSQPHVAPTPPNSEKYRTTDPPQSADEALGATSSGQPEDPNVDNTITSSDMEVLQHMQECEGEQKGSSADKNTKSEEDSDTATTCNPSPPHNPRFTGVSDARAPSQASSDRTDFYGRQHPPEGSEQDAGHEGDRTTAKLKSANEAQGQRSSGRPANLNVNDKITLSHVKESEHVQECLEEQGEVTSAENTKSVVDSKKETVYGQLPPCSYGYSPYILQNIPDFLRWQAQRHPHVGREQDAAREGTRTTDRLSANEKASGSRFFRQRNNLNVEISITSSDGDGEELVHVPECQEAQEAASAAQNTQSVEDSSEETLLRPFSPYSAINIRVSKPYINKIDRHHPMFQRWTPQPNLAPSARPNSYQRQHPLVKRDQDAVQERNRTTDPLESDEEAAGPCSARQRDSLHRDDRLSHIKKQAHKQECEEIESGETTDESIESEEDSSKEAARRPPPPHSNPRSTRVFEPEALRAGQHHHALNDQPNQASSDRANFHQRQHPPVEIEQDGVQEESRTTDPQPSADDTSSGASSSRWPVNLNNVDDPVLLSHLKTLAYLKECSEKRRRATAALITQPVGDSGTEAADTIPPLRNPRFTRDSPPYIQQTHQPHLESQMLQRGPPVLISSARTNLYQRQRPRVEREQHAVKRRTRTTKESEACGKSSGASRTTDPPEFDEEAAGPSSARHRDRLHRDDRLSHIKKQARKQECEEIESGETTDESIESEEDSSKEAARRPPPHYHPRIRRVYVPKAFLAVRHDRPANDQSNQAPSDRNDIYQRQRPQVEREQDAVQRGTRTADPQPSADDTSSGARSSRWPDNLNDVDDDPVMSSQSKWRASLKELEERQRRATAAQKTQPVEGSSTKALCRPPRPPYNQRFTRVLSPYTQLTHQHHPAFQRLQRDQPRQAPSAMADVYQSRPAPCPLGEMQCPRVEREQDAAKRRTRTTNTPEACASSSRRRDNMNVDNMMMSSGNAGQAHRQTREGAQLVATAAQNKASVEDRSKRPARRPELSLSSISSNEEGDQCRICHSSKKSQANPLLSPCRCSGSLRFVHLECLKIWVTTKLQTRPHPSQARICELCMGQLSVDPALFDLEAHCRRYYPQIIFLPEQLDERRMRFVRRGAQRRPPPEAPDT